MMEDFFYNFTVLETIGAAMGVIQVLLSRQNNVHNYLFGIAGVLIGIWIYYQHKLYADILLNTYYLVMSVYGWFYWKFGNKSKEAFITYSGRSDYFKAGGIVVFCFALMWYWLSSHTDSDVPFWDSLVVAFAWGGMWLMANRKIENWLFLNMSNLIAFPLLIYKELYIYSGLTVFLFIMGISGYIKWKQLFKIQQDELAENQ